MVTETDDRSQVDAQAIARFKLLTESALPALAQRFGWPVRFDHCFKRICLDWGFGGIWYEYLARPAERHLEGEALQRVLQCAEELVVGGVKLLQERDAASLKWRGKRPKAAAAVS